MKENKKYTGQVVGFQKVISEVILQDNGHHRLEVECIRCGHKKTMAIHDLFRKDRRTGACTKCHGGKTPSNKIGKVVGTLKIVSIQRNGHYKKMIARVICINCGEEDARNYVSLTRSTGVCKSCKKKTRDEERIYSRKEFSRAFRRANPIEACAQCGLSEWMGKKLPMHVDHIIPVSKGGRSKLSNAQYLCGNCHSIKTAEEHPFT